MNANTSATEMKIDLHLGKKPSHTFWLAVFMFSSTGVSSLYLAKTLLSYESICEFLMNPKFIITFLVLVYAFIAAVMLLLRRDIKREKCEESADQE